MTWVTYTMIKFIKNAFSRLLRTNFLQSSRCRWRFIHSSRPRLRVGSCAHSVTGEATDTIYYLDLNPTGSPMAFKKFSSCLPRHSVFDLQRLSHKLQPDAFLIVPTFSKLKSELVFVTPKSWKFWPIFGVKDRSDRFKFSRAPRHFRSPVIRATWFTLLSFAVGISLEINGYHSLDGLKLSSRLKRDWNPVNFNGDDGFKLWRSWNHWFPKLIANKDCHVNQVISDIVGSGTCGSLRPRILQALSSRQIPLSAEIRNIKALGLGETNSVDCILKWTLPSSTPLKIFVIVKTKRRKHHPLSCFYLQ